MENYLTIQQEADLLINKKVVVSRLYIPKLGGKFPIRLKDGNIIIGRVQSWWHYYGGAVACNVVID